VAAQDTPVVPQRPHSAATCGRCSRTEEPPCAHHAHLPRLPRPLPALPRPLPRQRACRPRPHPHSLACHRGQSVNQEHGLSLRLRRRRASVIRPRRRGAAARVRPHAHAGRCRHGAGVQCSCGLGARDAQSDCCAVYDVRLRHHVSDCPAPPRGAVSSVKRRAWAGSLSGWRGLAPCGIAPCRLCLT
jgi:hypothetical protein